MVKYVKVALYNNLTEQYNGLSSVLVNTVADISLNDKVVITSNIVKDECETKETLYSVGKVVELLGNTLPKNTTAAPNYVVQKIDEDLLSLAIDELAEKEELYSKVLQRADEVSEIKRLRKLAQGDPVMTSMLDQLYGTEVQASPAVDRD